MPRQTDDLGQIRVPPASAAVTLNPSDVATVFQQQSAPADRAPAVAAATIASQQWSPEQTAAPPATTAPHPPSQEADLTSAAPDATTAFQQQSAAAPIAPTVAVAPTASQQWSLQQTTASARAAATAPKHREVATAAANTASWQQSVEADLALQHGVMKANSPSASAAPHQCSSKQTTAHPVPAGSGAPQHLCVVPAAVATAITQQGLGTDSISVVPVSVSQPAKQSRLVTSSTGQDHKPVAGAAVFGLHQRAKAHA